MDVSELVSCCRSLSSTKVTERKRSADQLSILLENENVLATLDDDSGNISWNEVVESIHNLLLMEARKLAEDEVKNKKTSTSLNTRINVGDLFVTAVKKGCRRSNLISVSKLIDYIQTFFNSKSLKKYFNSCYLLVLRDHVLSNKINYGLIESQQWIDLFCSVKKCLQKSTSHTDETKLLSCLQLLLKWGPLHRLPCTFLREEFSFITEICQKLKSSLTKVQQETILGALLEFSYHTAIDNRVACCKLGESIFSNLIDIYLCHTGDSNIKISIIKFLLFQIRIHHPKGSVEGESLAYAYSWSDWYKYLRSLYSVLCKEMTQKEQAKFKLPMVKPPYYILTSHKKFISLFVEVFRQVNNAKVCAMDTTYPPPTKRVRADVGTSAVISNIQETKDWPWINVMSAILKRYPNIINGTDFIWLLRVLSTLQSESNFAEVNYHLYECLTVMVDVEVEIGLRNCPDVDSIWTIVVDCTLRAIGLNQNEEQTHRLLQKLITSNTTFNSAQLFKTYLSGVLNLSEYSIRSLSCACSRFNVSCATHTHGDIDNNKSLIEWILKRDNEKSVDTKIFSDSLVAQTLVCLTLKQWPININNAIVHNFEDGDTIENSYLLTFFDRIIISNTKTNQNVEKCVLNDQTHLKRDESFEFLEKSLREFLANLVDSNVKQFTKALNIINGIILLSNVLSYMVEFDLVQENDLENNAWTNTLRQALEKWFEIMPTLFQNLNKKKNVDHMCDVLEQVKKLFDLNINSTVLLIVKKCITIDFIKYVFELVNEDDNLTEDKEFKNTLSSLAVQVLCNFCLVPNSLCQFETQLHVLQELSEPNFDIKLKADYDKAMVFLNSLKRFKPGVLSVSVLEKVLQNIQIICEAYYTRYDTALAVLKILHNLLPHIASAGCSELGANFVCILNVFYLYHNNFGPNVQIALLDNIKGLVKVNADWAKWLNGDDIICSSAEFLTSNCQIVRLTAIENLSNIFSCIPHNDAEENQQKILFELVCKKTKEVFNVSGVLSEDHKVDETLTRTSSALHTFAAVISANANFRGQGLFSLFQLVQEKELNLDLTTKILEMVANYLKITSTCELIKLNLNYLISHWKSNKLDIRQFPYTLLGCTSLKQFCSKYMQSLISVLLTNDLSLFEETCAEYKLPKEELLKMFYPKVMAEYIINVTSNTPINESYNILEAQLSSETVTNLLLEKMSQIICCLIENCYDPKNINEKFETYWALPQPQTMFCSVVQLETCIKHIELTYLNGNSLIGFCLQKFKEKMQKMLLKLICNVHAAGNREEKAIAFHQFTVFVDLLIPYLKPKHDLNVFLFRTITYALIHLLNNGYENSSNLHLMYCKFIHIFLSKTLPENCKILEKFLIAFVSTLIPIARIDNSLGAECVKLLSIMIVGHGAEMADTLKFLDPFPSEPKFAQMQLIYNEIKYRDSSFTLQDEIEYFLKPGTLVETVGCRTEGLSHLKKQLSNRKCDLKEMYNDLNNLRGFSEDCRSSVLHQLVCTLVKLSLSENVDESLEASKCLGQLGSADLSTTVLQSEEDSHDKKLNCFELVTKSIVKLLVEYIVDDKIKVMEAASNALYHVLNCKEGKSVVKDNWDALFITPFIPARAIKSATNYSLTGDFQTVIDCNQLWCPEASTTHQEWITRLVSTLLIIFSDKKKTEFAEQLLPLVVYLVIDCGHAVLISKQIRQFFSMHWLHVLDQSIGGAVTVNKLSVQCMLNTVNFIRLRRNLENNTKFNQFCLNYLHVAQAAQFCSAHFTALLYVELWCQERLKEIQGVVDDNYANSTSFTYLDIIVRHEESNGKRLLHILKECYKKIGETDAVRICQSTSLSDTKVQIEHYEQLHRWDRVALLYDIQISQGNLDCVPNLLNTLRKCSLFELPYRYDNFHSPQFDCAWRLNQWNIDDTAVAESSNAYEKYKYFTLKAIHDDDKSSFNRFIKDARSFTINCLRHTSLESSKNLYEPLTRLQSLSELEEFVAVKERGDFEPLIEKWRIQNETNRNEFQYVEPINAQRVILLRNLVISGNTSLKKYLIETQLRLAGFARSCGNQNTAIRILSDLLHTPDLTEEVQDQIKLEEAQLRWLDDKFVARQILRDVLNRSSTPRLRAAALKLYGTWMIETSSENPQTIINNYFLESLKLMKTVKTNDADVQHIYDTYDVLARFADSQYQQVQTHIKSSIFERKVKNMEKAKANALTIKAQAKRRINEDETRAIITFERQSAIDQSEINNIYKEKKMYLMLNSDKNNVRIFRILSLLLENRSNTDLETFFNNNVPNIPSYKFIPILPQLIPHMSGNTEDVIGNCINAIIERCCRDHPHHTLPFVLSLAHSNHDKTYYKSKTNTSSNEPRIAGANELIKTLKKDAKLKRIIEKMEIVSKALMHLAYIEENDCETARKKEFLIPLSCQVSKIKNFDDILLPTHTLPVQKNCNYTNIVGIRCFNRTFSFVGGLNRPKRICCIGTDGIQRDQLVKGRDDLRQDAVMQQVFSIMNSLLAGNKQTAKLLIRTYKIVPLSQRSGVLEWVDNSFTIGDYLVGDEEKKEPGAHSIYNRDDISPARCRLEFKNVAKASHKEKLNAYNNICRRFHPVFHKFFENSFVQPAVWYERRRAYTHSVATTSMCGYILGLGDRHVNNILIDKSSAEVVHIDFGIAFEQGLVLPTAETVPFRLTRDIEAGMGVSGVEGVFRKSCEYTLEVLKKNSETIISILEVLLYDPLYAWTVTPAEAYNRQLNDDLDKNDTAMNSSDCAEDENINTTAERALMRLRQKLQGITEGGSVTNIEGQVEKLLQQARDPSNLCRLFHGWQPYL
ncbi:hypothetical protein RN001_014092 [Aquatica leii]|uniref:non-specific serine/threonine protein kinase n=1 Tax=Aquatica leii TaxID=1421715 RepID=A0AAN7PSJ5_9COLE|nr:hypothetical protein RN001_014092 [Aquatica leii]